jgi:hypothetical protein
MTGLSNFIFLGGRNFARARPTRICGGNPGVNPSFTPAMLFKNIR